MKFLFKFETFDAIAIVKQSETVWTKLKDCKPTKAGENPWKMVTRTVKEVGLSILNIDLYSNLEVIRLGAYTYVNNSSC